MRLAHRAGRARGPGAQVHRPTPRGPGRLASRVAQCCARVGQPQRQAKARPTATRQMSSSLAGGRASGRHIPERQRSARLCVAARRAARCAAHPFMTIHGGCPCTAAGADAPSRSAQSIRQISDSGKTSEPRKPARDAGHGARGAARRSGMHPRSADQPSTRRPRVGRRVRPENVMGARGPRPGRASGQPAAVPRTRGGTTAIKGPPSPALPRRPSHRPPRSILLGRS